MLAKTQSTQVSWLLVGMLGLVPLSLIGCKPNPPANQETSAHDDHHHEEHGPNGGHMVHLEPSDIHAEWAHDDDEGKISIYLTSALEAGKKIDSVKVELEIKGEPKKEYPFTPNDKGVYELVSQELLTAIEVGSGDSEKVLAKLVVSMDGKEETAKMEHHEHHHH